MFSSKDFEKCWFLYQSEGLPYNLSIEEFCLKQGVPVNEFNKWFRDTHKRIHPIQVSGVPTSERSSNFGNQAGCFRGSSPFQRVSPYRCNHLHEQWVVCQTEELKLREPSEIRRETGGLMLTISGLKRFYYIPGMTDMRCGYSR